MIIKLLISGGNPLYLRRTARNSCYVCFFITIIIVII